MKEAGSGSRGEAMAEEEAAGDNVGDTTTVQEVAARLGSSGRGGLQQRREGGGQQLWLVLMVVGKLPRRVGEGRGQQRQVAGETTIVAANGEKLERERQGNYSERDVSDGGSNSEIFDDEEVEGSGSDSRGQLVLQEGSDSSGSGKEERKNRVAEMAMAGEQKAATVMLLCVGGEEGDDVGFAYGDNSKGWKMATMMMMVMAV
ncbi:hypothetical protein B296_00017138 [Ensete ventricosum]|uniref:Uncharacterized protein n=1 Tax=Ensete ventricosum TaxID=4639 RepID=A0A426Y4P7_ENSVE|nr:hypothetical protein B296_00017138 [Ensete ventricosum]